MRYRRRDNQRAHHLNSLPASSKQRPQLDSRWRLEINHASLLHTCNIALSLAHQAHGRTCTRAAAAAAGQGQGQVDTACRLCPPPPSR